jgi:hypothetical protein
MNAIEKHGVAMMLKRAVDTAAVQQAGTDAFVDASKERASVKKTLGLSGRPAVMFNKIVMAESPQVLGVTHGLNPDYAKQQAMAPSPGKLDRFTAPVKTVARDILQKLTP